jgi:hypothetical protein
MPTEGAHVAAIIELSGAVAITGTASLSRGFLGEVIGFDDGAQVSVGRAVWTDARGDRVFSVLRGAALETGRRIRGEITGGTGSYAGISGEYELSWQYIARGENNTVQGRAADLKGAFRLRRAPR